MLLIRRTPRCSLLALHRLLHFPNLRGVEEIAQCGFILRKKPLQSIGFAVHQLENRNRLRGVKKALSDLRGPFCVALKRAGGGELLRPAYFGGVGVNPSRLRPGSGLGLGLGAFFVSFLPLSLLPMGVSVTQEGRAREGKKLTNDVLSISDAGVPAGGLGGFERLM